MKVIELNHGFATIVDDEDFDRFAQYRWSYGGGKQRSGGYALRNCNGNATYLHREIMAAPKDVEIDHINGNKLDNRKANLRFATRSQNKANVGIRKDNATGIKGVSEHHRKKGFVAQISLHGKSTYLGIFRTKEDAKAAYDKAAVEHFGEFAKLN